MNIVVCENIKDVALQLQKQIEQQINDPETTEQQRNRLVDADLSMGGAASFLLQAMENEVERLVYKEEE